MQQLNTLGSFSKLIALYTQASSIPGSWLSRQGIAHHAGAQENRCLLRLQSSTHSYIFTLIRLLRALAWHVSRDGASTTSSLEMWSRKASRHWFSTG